MQAQGPLIKGMNHAVSAGGLAAEAYQEAKTRGDASDAGDRYERKLRDEGVMQQLRPRRYRLTRAVSESDLVDSVNRALLNSPVGSLGLKAFGGLAERAFNSPFLLGMIPDTRLSYVDVPIRLAEVLGEPIEGESRIEPPELDERIGDLTYNVGEPHIQLQDESFATSGTAVTACPVSAKDFGGGCYRDEYVQTNGGEEHLVSLDTQPCVECGTCAIVADTHWEHPSGGKGVEYQQG